MKKLFVSVIAAVGLLGSATTFAALPENVVGSWLLVEENGQPQTEYSKNYFPNGRFNVEKRCKTDSIDNGTSKVVRYSSTVQQTGTWEMVNDSTIVEKCEWGDKGDVKISFSLTGDLLRESFAYDAAPSTQYSQKFSRIETITGEPKELRVRSAVPEIRIKHCGTVGGNFDRIVYIFDGKRCNSPEELNELIPDDCSKVENFSCIKDRSIYQYMTDEEIAAGKDTVFIVTLKK